jgi:hypothetical protein
MLQHFVVQRAHLRGKVVSDRTLQRQRGRLAARDQRAKVVATDEPSVDVRRGKHRRRAGAALDERHLAEGIAVAQLGDRERPAAGQRDPRLHGPVPDQVGTARR